MRIAFDYQIFGWQQYGGISRYAYELASALATYYEQNVAIISPLYINRYLQLAPSELKVFGRRVPCWPKTGRIYRAINSLFAWPIMRLYGPDIVHETYFSSNRIAPKGAKVVLTVYDMIHERFRDNFSNFDPTSREKALAVMRADHVICISEQTKRDLVDLLGIDPNKVSVVYLGFTLTQFSDLERFESAGRPYLLYVGNRGGYKNFEGLLQAYASSGYLMENYDLFCFGGGDFLPREKNLFSELGIPDENIRQISGDDALLARYYRSASAFVYPSLYEGFGIPPLEAMSFDCPVVCSNVSSIPEVVGDAGEMFDPYDLESIRNAIERVLRDSVLRADLIARGQKRIELFSWERCARETLAIYRQVLS